MNYDISPRRLKGGLAHVGFLPKEYVSAPSKTNQDITDKHLDLDFRDYAYEHPLPVVIERQYGFVGTTFDSVAKALLLFDHEPSVPDYPTKLLDRAQEILVEMLREKGIVSRCKTFYDVNWNTAATTGWGFGKHFKTKMHYLTSYRGLTDLEDYWNFAESFDATPLWKVAGKNEILPVEKIDSDDQRIFEIPPVNYLGYGLRLFQDFNDDMHHHWLGSPFALGTTMQRGGLDKLLRSIDLGGTKFTEDVRKWDKNFRAELQYRCRDIRVAVYEEGMSGVSKSEYTRRVNWFYERSTYAYVVTPWGQVFQLLGVGEPSGTPNTSADNTLANTLILFAYVLSEFPACENWRDINRLLAFKNYADDNVSCTAPQANFLAEFERRRLFFERCGFALKPEDDCVSDTFTGLTFLGAKVEKYFGVLVPVYNKDRVVAGLKICQRKSLTPRERFNKVLSLLLLSTFNDPLFDWIYDYLRHLLNKYDREYGIAWASDAQIDPEKTDDVFAVLEYIRRIKLPFLPTRTWCIEFWTNLEARACEKVNFWVHGNYVGPGFNDGKWQNSGDPELYEHLPVDRLDEGGRDHDIEYFIGEDLARADKNLADLAWEEPGIKSKLTWFAIRTQQLLREAGIMARKGNVRKAEAKVAQAEARIAKLENHALRGGGRGRSGRGPRRNMRRSYRGRRGGGIPASNARVVRARRPTRIRNRGSNRVVISGSEYVGDVTISSTNTVGDILTNLPVSPQLLNGTRLATLAQLWERWRIIKWSMRWVPIAPTSAPGQIILGFDPDIADVWADNPLNVQKLIELKGVSLPIYGREMRVAFRPEKQMQNLYGTNSVDERFSIPGRFLAILASASTGTTLTAGNLFLDYTIEFFKPTLDSAVGDSSGSFVVIGTGTQNFGSSQSAISSRPGSNVVCAWISGSTLNFQNVVPNTAYVVNAYLTYNATGANTLTCSIAGAVLNQSFNAGQGSQSGAATTKIGFHFHVTTNAVTNFSINCGGGLPGSTTVTTWDLECIQVPWSNEPMEIGKSLPKLTKKGDIIARLKEMESFCDFLSKMDDHAPRTLGEITEWKTDDEYEDDPPVRQRDAASNGSVQNSPKRKRK